jgi:hypothetical protein
VVCIQVGQLLGRDGAVKRSIVAPASYERIRVVCFLQNMDLKGVIPLGHRFCLFGECDGVRLQ